MKMIPVFYKSPNRIFNNSVIIRTNDYNIFNISLRKIYIITKTYGGFRLFFSYCQGNIVQSAPRID